MMAQVGQWDHRELAIALGQTRPLNTDAAVVKDAAAALRDLGDRLDKAEAELSRRPVARPVALKDADDQSLMMAGERAAYLECARLAEEEAARIPEEDWAFARMFIELAAKFRQLAETG